MVSPRTAGTECGPKGTTGDLTEKNIKSLERTPYESYEENFERNLVFLKALKNGKLENRTLNEMDLTALELLPDERRTFLDEIKKRYDAINKEKDKASIMLKTYFNTNLDETQVDNLMGLFNNQGKLIEAHHCNKKGNPYQTVLARTLVAISHGEKSRSYSFNAEKYQCHSISHESNVRSTTIRDLCIQLVSKDTKMSTFMKPTVEKINKSINYYHVAEGVERYKTMFIELNDFQYSANYLSFKSEGFFETNFVRDSIIKNPRNVSNIHPKLAYLFYTFEKNKWLQYFFEGKHVYPQIPADMDISNFIVTKEEKKSFGTTKITLMKNSARIQSIKTSIDIEKLNNAVTAMYYGACFRVSLELSDPYTFYLKNFPEKVKEIVHKKFSDEDIAYIEEMSKWTGASLSFDTFKKILQNPVSGGSKKIQKTQKVRRKARKSRGTRSR